MKAKTTALPVLCCALLVLVAAPLLAATPGVQWHSYEEGLARGKFEQKKVLIHFYAEWCVYCKRMEQETFRDPAVVGLMNEQFVAVRVDADREAETAALFQVRGLPDTYFMAEDGDIIGHRPGYIDAGQMKVILNLLLDQ
jgi:thioredoxin-related protein